MDQVMATPAAPSQNAADPIIEVRDLALAYAGQGGARVLEGLTLSVPRGGFVAVVGHSGVGKSTLLRVVAGLVPSSSGEVRLMTSAEPGRRATALVFQDPRLLAWRSVLRNVEFGLEGLEHVRSERRRRAHEALELVGLTEHVDKWPHQLSGGQRQRVGIARALAVAPDLLLMDEPFSALDALTRQNLQDELLRIWQRTGKSVLFVTHDLTEAVYLADRVIVLGGRPASAVQDFVVAAPRPRVRDAKDLSSTTQQVRVALEEAYLEGEGI
jgi:NitT/TauT family transport system ATP-binding protein